MSWRRHVIIIKPTSGRLEGYVLTFLCSHKLTVPDFNSECEPRNNAALLTQYPPQAEGRARARADFIALPFLAQLKTARRVTQKRVETSVLSSGDF